MKTTVNSSNFNRQISQMPHSSKFYPIKLLCHMVTNDLCIAYKGSVNFDPITRPHSFRTDNSNMLG